MRTGLKAQGIPGIYRIHETPDPKRIVEFEETAAQFGYTLGFSNLPVKTSDNPAETAATRAALAAVPRRTRFLKPFL